LRIFKESEKRLMPLSVHHIPITFTFALIEEGENSAIAIDPTVN
jgi:exosome complex RNA-binding protein Rrp42 (RNase PH superfamily)